MSRTTSKIIKPEDIIIQKSEKKFFSKKRKYINPASPALVFDKFKTLDENKTDYYKTLNLVFSRKFSTLTEAYLATR